MANIDDKFTKAADKSGAYPTVASVSQPREAMGDTLSCNDLSGWPTDTAVHFTTFRVLADGKVDTSVQTDYKGIVSGNTITQVKRIAGAEDSGHLVGDKVELNPTAGWVADLVEGLLKSHNQDGTLKNDIIQTSNIANNAVTGEKIQDGSIKPSKIDWGNYKYSADTPIRIGTWLDGKPLLRKVFQFSFDRAKGVEQSMSIGLTKEQVKRLDAYYNETSGSSGLPVYEQSDTDKFGILVKHGNLVFRVGSTWPANGNIIAYVDYTE